MPRALLEHEINTLGLLVATAGVADVLACLGLLCDERSGREEVESEAYLWRHAARMCRHAAEKIPKKLA